MHGAIMGEDILKKCRELLLYTVFSGNNCSCGKACSQKRIIKTGTAGLVYRKSRSAGCTDCVAFHCIIHKQTLRGELLNLSRVKFCRWK